MPELAPTRALSLIQPWAWAILHAGKNVENRVWSSNIRGPFWIAASATTSYRYYDQARRIIEAISDVTVPPRRDLVYGSILGQATIYDCIRPNENRGNPWHFSGQYGYLLRDVRTVTPVPCKGHQRWWNVPESVLSKLVSS